MNDHETMKYVSFRYDTVEVEKGLYGMTKSDRQKTYHRTCGLSLLGQRNRKKMAIDSSLAKCR